MKFIYRVDVSIETKEPIPEFTDEFGERMGRAISEIGYAGARIMLNGLPASLGRITIHLLPLEETDEEQNTSPS